MARSAIRAATTTAGVALGVAALLLGCTKSGSISPDASNEGGAEGGLGDGGTTVAESGSLDAEGADGEASVPAMLSGSAQKGPLALGSTVTIAEVDAHGSPTGRTYDTQTTDNLGHFAVTFLPAGDYSISVSGYYFDEIRGQLSTAPVTLRGLHRVRAGGPATATVNVITHLAYNRAVALAASGTDLAAAESKAESELRSSLALAVSPSGAADQSDLLGGDNDANAYALAVAVLFTELAVETAGTGSVDGTLSQLLNQAASQLATGGQLQTTTVAGLKGVQGNIYPEVVADNLSAYLASNGTTVTLPDLNRVLDTDQDGIANDVDNCALVANPMQQPITGKICRLRRHRTPFGPTNVTYANAFSIATGDFNGDGHLDAFVLNARGGTYGAFLGDGSGHFRYVGTSLASLPDQAGRWFALDVDQDGHVDLVQFSPSFAAAPSDILLEGAGYYPGNGDGTFRSLVSFESPDAGTLTIRDGTLFDLDGDGILDLVTTNNLVTTNSSSGAILFRKGMGHGIFVQGTALPVSGMTPDSVFTSNGDLILSGANAQNQTQVCTLIGNGHGGFTQVGPSGALAPAYALGDVDGDGNVDVIGAYTVGTGPAFNFGVTFGTGGGAFGTSATWIPSLVTNNKSNYFSFTTGTFLKTTGIVAFAATSASSFDLMFVPGSASPFAAPQILTQPDHTAQNFGALTTADIDGDGKADFLYSNKNYVTNQAELWAMIVN